MATHHVVLTDTEEHIFDAYVRWHQEQPQGSVRRVIPVGEISSVDALLSGVFEPVRALLQRWWETHPEVQGEPSAHA